MKKLLFVSLLFALTQLAYAQGGLTIINNSTCPVWVKMFASDASSGFPACSINSNTFLVPGTTTWTWCSVWDFQGPVVGCGTAPMSIGWMTPTLIPSSSTGFTWSDVTFQYMRCGDCNGGGNMSDACGFACVGGFPFWSNGCHTVLSTWSPVCLLPMGNLTLTFN